MQIINFVETFEMQVEFVIEFGGGIELLFLTAELQVLC